MATMVRPAKLDDAAIATMKATFRGEVIRREDPGYDAARRVFNAAVDRRPALIVRPVDVGDIRTALQFGIDHRMEIAVRGAGHHGAGFGTVDDGLVIDLGRLRGIRVDPLETTVRVEPGCTLADLDHATHAFGLAVPTGIFGTTGVAGLTLGGGVGHLTRKHGLTIDNLLEADVLLASGEVVTASATANAELFWALRGGGGNFGIVTSFLFRAHPVSTVVGGPTFYELDQAEDVLRWYRDFMPAAPPDLNGFFAFLTVPPGPPFPEHLHGEEDGRHRLVLFRRSRESRRRSSRRSMRSARLPWTGSSRCPFLPFRPHSMRSTRRGSAGTGAPTSSPRSRTLRSRNTCASPRRFRHGSPRCISIRSTERRMTEARPTPRSVIEMPAGPRSWSGSTRTLRPSAATAAWTTAYWEALHPYSAGGAYVNMYMAEGPDRIRKSYGANYDRLVRAKAQFDPENVFRLNQNIRPG